MENPNSSDFFFFLSKNFIPSFLPSFSSLPGVVATYIVRLSDSEVHLNYVGFKKL